MAPNLHFVGAGRILVIHGCDPIFIHIKIGALVKFSYILSWNLRHIVFFGRTKQVLACLMVLIGFVAILLLFEV
jgi:hypothetical protein